jgi:hypothetical protein
MMTDGLQFTSNFRAANLPGIWPLAKGLRTFFSERINAQQAQEGVKRAFHQRDAHFLQLVRTRIYQYPSSPYRRLLKIAGCEFSDIQTHVQKNGVDKTLDRLAHEGVYLSADEFKGKKDIVRGGQSFRAFPGDFEFLNILPSFHVESSGTNNRPVRSAVSLDWLSARTWAMGVFFSAHNLYSRSLAVYDAILPAAGGLNNLMAYAKLGISTHRWFARRIPVNGQLEAIYHYLLTRLIVTMGNWFGSGFPKPEFIDLKDIHHIVFWASHEEKKGRLCCIRTAASNAVRIARVAYKAGISLEATTFIASGEPLTQTKRNVIKRVGACVIPQYGSLQAGEIGYGCARALHLDEVHANEHMLAILSHPGTSSPNGSATHPLLFTTLHPSTPRLLLNVELGDYATLERRDCGCTLGNAGLTLHLHHIGSYEKFTSEGMNYFYGDLYDLLEGTLPAEFGGGPGDYQLVEEEDEKGQTRLTLVVHPSVGQLDENNVLDRVRAAFSNGSRGNRFITRVWQNAGTFRVRRTVPHSSGRGKILPLHIPRSRATV